MKFLEVNEEVGTSAGATNEVLKNIDRKVKARAREAVEVVSGDEEVP